MGKLNGLIREEKSVWQREAGLALSQLTDEERCDGVCGRSEARTITCLRFDSPANASIKSDIVPFWHTMKLFEECEGTLLSTYLLPVLSCLPVPTSFA